MNILNKIFLITLLIPNFLIAEVLSVDLICKGNSDIFCKDKKKCGSEKFIEKIKIAGNTLEHRIHGNHFLNVNKDTVSTKELDTDGSIGFSFIIDRNSGEIEIIRGWDRPYHFKGVCELDRLDIFKSLEKN